MSNRIDNMITIIGSDQEIAQIQDYVRSDTSVFDFNKIIPMPKELDIEESSLGEIGMDYLLYRKTIDPPQKAKLSIERFETMNDAEQKKALDLGRKYLENIIKFGCRTWYDWRLDHWGSKWNAIDAEVDGKKIYFSTPWSPPYEILVHLSETFPSVRFEYDYFDDTNMSSADGAIQAGEELWYRRHDGYPVDDNVEDIGGYQELSTNNSDAILDQSATQGQMDYDELPF